MTEKAAERYQFGDLNVQQELATLAQNRLQISQCAGGHQIAAHGPCDHCGSANPATNCLFGQGSAVIIGDPLNTNQE